MLRLFSTRKTRRKQPRATNADEGRDWQSVQMYVYSAYGLTAGVADDLSSSGVRTDCKHVIGGVYGQDSSNTFLYPFCLCVYICT